MKRNLVFILIFFSVELIAQQSIYKTYSGSINLTKSIEINKNSSSLSSGQVVFGYLPWWIYADSSYTTVLEHRNLVSHIAVFSYTADSLGNIAAPPYWPWNDILAFTKMMSPTAPRIVMTVTNFNGSAIHKILNDETTRLQLINNISDTIAYWGMNGVNIDFENVLVEDRGIAINNFMLQLNNSVKKVIPSAEVSVAVPAVNWGGWDFKGLAESCDYLIMMGYDYNGNWSTTTGPSAPLTGSGDYSYDVQKSINVVYKDVVNANPEKLILGVPYYGNYWTTNSSVAYCAVDTASAKRSWQSSPYYREIISQYDSKEKFWDNVSQTPWLKWNDGSTWNQIWYDNDSSLALKYDLVLSKNLKGIGIWALGYDYGREELWNVINRKLTVTAVEEETSLPTAFILYQNYPNPFNPSTTIQYSIPASLNPSEGGTFVKLKVFDMLGREVATLVNENKPAGSYSVTFNVKTLHGASLPSGIYFYQLHASDYLETRKMLLIK
jgi:spore germination protein YaaH